MSFRSTKDTSPRASPLKTNVLSPTLSYRDASAGVVQYAANAEKETVAAAVETGTFEPAPMPQLQKVAPVSKSAEAFMAQPTATYLETLMKPSTSSRAPVASHVEAYNAPTNTPSSFLHSEFAK